jgi:murein L,D-transpeptidase YafK
MNLEYRASPHRKRLVRILSWFFMPLLAVVLVAGLAAWTQWPPPPLPEGALVAEMRLHKSERSLLVLDATGAVLARYRVSLGRSPEGPKRVQGDNRTPEGRYRISGRNPQSKYHLSMHISYPSAEDKAQAAVQNSPPGGDIMIHGLPNRLGLLGKLHRLTDWTAGCIAVTDQEMDQIWRHVPDGTPILITP